MVKDFSKGKIYKIVNDENNLFYVGSTVSTLCKRMYIHRSTHNKCMSKNIGVDLNKCSIILLENYSCKDENELKRKEREYFDKYKLENKEVFLNKNRPILYEGELKEYLKEYRQKPEIKEKLKEYYKNHPERKEKQNTYSKEYYKNNPEIKEKQKEYSQKPEIKEKAKEYYKKHPELKENAKTYSKQYYKNHPEIKEKQKTYSKEYYKNNPEKAKEYIKKHPEIKIKSQKKWAEVKINCICGSSIRKDAKCKHINTKKHIKYLATII